MALNRWLYHFSETVLYRILLAKLVVAFKCQIFDKRGKRASVEAKVYKLRRIPQIPQIIARKLCDQSKLVLGYQLKTFSRNYLMSTDMLDTQV